MARGIGNRTVAPEDKRALLLDAAERAFARDGYAGTTMASVAGEADVTRPTVYSYFQSKDQLFQALAVRVRDEVLQLQELADVSTPEATVRSTLVANLDVFVRHHAMLVVVAARALSDDRTRDLYDEINRRTNRRHARFLDRLAAEGVIALPAPAPEVAEAVTGMVRGLAAIVHTQPSRQEELSRSLVAMYIQLVGLSTR